MSEIEILRKEVENVKVVDIDFVKIVILEFDGVKEFLEKLLEEENIF